MRGSIMGHSHRLIDCYPGSGLFLFPRHRIKSGRWSRAISDGRKHTLPFISALPLASDPQPGSRP